MSKFLEWFEVGGCFVVFAGSFGEEEWGVYAEWCVDGEHAAYVG